MDDKPPFYQALVIGQKYGDEPELRVKDWKTEHTISDLGFMDDQMKRETMAIYYGMVSQVDHHVGRILDYMEANRLMENTMIVFTSDHGDYMGNHGMFWKGLPAYEDVHRVPFIAVHPQCRTPGAKSDAIQSLVDLPATFLHSVGIGVPAGYQGVVQEDAWTDAGESGRDWAMVEFRPTESPFMQKTYVNKRYKLVVYHQREYGELYDLQADPQQYFNLWNNPHYREIRLELLCGLISAEMEKDGKLLPRMAIA